MNKYKIFCVLNNVPREKIEESLRSESAWILAKSLAQMDIEYVFQEVNEPVVWVGDSMHWADFSCVSRWHDKAKGCQAILYFYDPLKHNDPGGVINGTTFNKRVWIQVIAREDYNSQIIFEELRHEMIHGFHGNLKSKGYITFDQLDSYPDNTLPEGEKSYDKEIDKFQSFWKQLCEPLKCDSIWYQLVQLFQKKSVRDLAEAMAIFEGFYMSGTRAQRNHNPLNIKYVGQPIAIGKDDKNFCIFPSDEIGWLAAVSLLRVKCFDKFIKEGSITDLIKNWTGGDSEAIQTNYINFVCKTLGIPVDFPARYFRY